MRDEYFSMFGGWAGVPGGTSCEMSPDVPGTIAGAWFNEPFDAAAFVGPEPGWGLTVREGVDGVVTIISERQEVRTRSWGATYADPASVTGEHCYEHDSQPAKYAYLELLSAMELAAAFGDGPCPAAMPQDRTVYYR